MSCIRYVSLLLLIIVGCSNENPRNVAVTKVEALQTQEQTTNKTEETNAIVEKISEEEHKNNLTIFEEIRNGGFSRGHYLTEITPEIARILIVQDADVGLNRVKSISVETAKEYINHRSVYLRSLTSVSTEVVRILNEIQSDEDEDGDFLWELSGLKTISVELARELAQVKAYLHLDGLTSISKEVAHELAQHCGFPLFLNGLKSISVDVARELAKHDDINLDGLESIDFRIAREFAKIKTHVNFNGLTSISAEVAYELTGYKVVDLCLNSLESISFEVAQVFGEFNGRISLHGLKSLTEEAAIELAKCDDRVGVNSSAVYQLLDKYR